MSACPNISCTPLSSAPPSSRCVANECLSICGVICFFIPAWRAYFLIIFHILCRESPLPSLERNRCASCVLEANLHRALSRYFSIAFPATSGVEPPLLNRFRDPQSHGRTDYTHICLTGVQRRRDFFRRAESAVGGAFVPDSHGPRTNACACLTRNPKISSTMV